MVDRDSIADTPFINHEKLHLDGYHVKWSESWRVYLVALRVKHRAGGNLLPLGKVRKG